MFKKINKYFIGYFFLSLFFLSFIFKGLILNISTDLIDWRDYAYVIWVMNQTVESIKEMSLSGLFNGNAFYPNEGILLFSDLLWPQAIMTLIFSFFTKNIITQFNLVFFSTLILNTIAIYTFWKTIFKDHKNTFFASLVTNFSPFLILEINHFQMITYWPFFFAMHYLFKNKKTIKDLILLAIFLSIQFYAAVYWMIFFITIMGLYYVVSFLKKENKLNLIRDLLIIGSLLIVFIGPIYFKYSQVQKAYGVNREYHEYVNYSAHITDYLFSRNFKSIVSQSKFFKIINSYNNHSSFSATIIIYLLSLIGIFNIKKIKENFSISFSLKKIDIIFLLIALIGFTFSLGPRFSFNGYYLSAPLPFALALKYLVIFEPIRATSRFAALFYIGLTYFAVKGLSKINKNNNFLLIIIALIIFFLEIIPTNFKTESNNYYPSVYNEISRRCNNKEVFLEYPFNQDTPKADIVTNLKYKASQLTAAVNHNCSLVNGYAGFDPKEYSDYITSFNTALQATNSASLSGIINQKNIEYIKVNKEYMSKDKLKQLDNIDFYNQFGTIISQDKEFTLIQIKKVNNE
jgi:hypothetical protein